MSKLTLSFKDRVLKVYPVLKGSMLIGSDPSCTIHIDSLALQAQHARIDTEDQTSTIVDLGSPDGTFVNQNKITEHTLKDGDLIRVGKHTLTYKYEQVEDMPSAAPPPPQPKVEEQPVIETEEPTTSEMETRAGFLQIMSGANLGKTMSLNRAMTNLGKPGVATAIIAKRNEGYFISHLEGKQAPLVGNTPIGDKTEKLNDGDIIQIGNIKMQFYLE
ncbi:MAG: FHA domain-containing protein [Gammaproteobacteria bacterium]